MNTQKQIFVMIVLMFMFVAGCAAYATIDLPIRAKRQADYFESESIERGALLFANNCRTCHGNRGQGGVGLPLNIDKFKDQNPLQLRQNQELIRRVLTCGRAGTLMPAWSIEHGGSLTSHQIEHLVRLITAPLEEGVVDANGNPTNRGWLAVEEFSHNLNAEASAVVGGDTLDSIASAHNIGPGELAALLGVGPDDPLPKGETITLPDGRTYKVREGDTPARVAARAHVGAVMIAQLNGISYAFDDDGNLYLPYDGSDPRLILDLEAETPATGLIPGTTLRLPEGATFNAVATQSLEEIAAQHGISVADIERLNPDVAGLIGDDGLLTEPIVLQLPTITAYVVDGQSLADVVATLAGVTVSSLAEANGLSPADVLPVGKVLAYPEDAWGTAPPDTINDGSACVQYIVTQSIYDRILPGAGVGDQIEIAKPEEYTEELRVLSHANDWTFVADGEELEPNRGGALIRPGTDVTFENVVGLHTITINGEKQGDDLGPDPVIRTVTFDTTGEFVITCDYHPDMYGIIWVE